jgi:hypothetical protein
MPTPTEYEQQFVSELKSLIVDCSSDALDVADLLRVHEIDQCANAASVGQRKEYAVHVAAMSYSYVQVVRAINATSTAAFLLSKEKRRQAKLYTKLKQQIAYALNAEFGQRAGPIVESFAADLHRS